MWSVTGTKQVILPQTSLLKICSADYALWKGEVSLEIAVAEVVESIHLAEIKLPKSRTPFVTLTCREEAS